MLKSTLYIFIPLLLLGYIQPQTSMGQQADTVSITVCETIHVSDQPVEVLPPVEIKVDEDVSVDDGQSRLPLYLLDPAGISPSYQEEREIWSLRERPYTTT